MEKGRGRVWGVMVPKLASFLHSLAQVYELLQQTDMSMAFLACYFRIGFLLFI